MHQDRLLPFGEVRAEVGLSRSKIYELLARDRFPSPTKVGRRNYFSQHEIQDWIAARLGERAQGGASK